MDINVDNLTILVMKKKHHLISDVFYFFVYQIMIFTI